MPEWENGSNQNKENELVRIYKNKLYFMYEFSCERFKIQVTIKHGGVKKWIKLKLGTHQREEAFSVHLMQ